MPVDEETAKRRDAARKRAKAPVEKPHPKKGHVMRATDAAPRAAGRSSRTTKKASPGEQGAHAGPPKHRGR